MELTARELDDDASHGLVRRQPTSWKPQFNEEMAEYLNTKKSHCPGEETHTLFTGGCFKITPQDTGKFRTLLAICMRNGDMQCLNEKRTFHFPFYADVDLKTALARLGDDAVFKIAECMNAKVKLFFAAIPEPLLVVCARNGDSKVVESGDGSKPDLYKHGLHLHWPEITVDVERARQIRVAMVHGLDFVDWTDALGAARVDWDDAVDEGAYRTGLRMVGAPKASDCVCKKTKEPDCTLCGGFYKKKVIDPRVYEFRMCLKGAHVANEILVTKTGVHVAKLLKYTSVRSEDVYAPRTEPYEVYKNCPALESRWGTKRKAQRQVDEAAKHLGPTLFNRLQEVRCSEVTKIAREHLLKHSINYATSKMRIMFDGEHFYKVLLTGEGSHFCLNKGECHTSQHVYMEIYAPYKGRGREKEIDGGNVASRMRCWCKKNTVRCSGVSCADYRGKPIKLGLLEKARLFIDVPDTELFGPSRKGMPWEEIKARDLYLNLRKQRSGKKQRVGVPSTGGLAGPGAATCPGASCP